jgi:antitoxin component of MazEF toxin-antitoxin module
MGFKAKIQLIKRKKSEQYYINFPSAVAQAMEFKKGDDVEWVVKSRHALTLQRVRDPEKKTTQDS